MITIHSNNKWILPFAPKFWKVRVVDDPHSACTIGAFCSYDHTISINDIYSFSKRYNDVLVYFCEPFSKTSDGKLFLSEVLRESPANVMIFSDVIFDREIQNHIYVGNWWMIHCNLYSETCWATGLMAELQHDIEDKPYHFDALLGARRPHRDFLYMACQQSQYRDRIFLTYHGNDARRGVWHTSYHAELCTNVDTSDPDQLAVTLWSIMPLPSGQLGHKVGTQNIIPTKIFNDCWYSIIAEGFIEHHGTRLTEKTAKALVAERLFVYFGAPNDLKRMQKLGFKTFGHVIDESYDLITDDNKRWKAAWQQVQWLCNQDPVHILAATVRQRAHNKRVFLETDWHAGLRTHLKQLCAKY